MLQLEKFSLASVEVLDREVGVPGRDATVEVPVSRSNYRFQVALDDCPADEPVRALTV